MKAFIKATKKILSSVSDEMLEALFLKVDTDCNGSITWVRKGPLLQESWLNCSVIPPPWLMCTFWLVFDQNF